MESRDTTPTPRGSLRRTPQHVLSSFLQTVTTSWFYIPATSGFRPTLADLGVLQSAENNAHGTYSTDTELIFKNQRVDGLRLCSNEKQELHGPAEACFTGARIQTCSGHVLSRLSVQTTRGGHRSPHFPESAVQNELRRDGARSCIQTLSSKTA